MTGDNALHMIVGAGCGVETETKEFVLCVVRNGGGVSETENNDALRLHDCLSGFLQLVCTEYGSSKLQRGFYVVYSFCKDFKTGVLERNFFGHSGRRRNLACNGDLQRLIAVKS